MNFQSLKVRYAISFLSLGAMLLILIAIIYFGGDMFWQIGIILTALFMVIIYTYANNCYTITPLNDGIETLKAFANGELTVRMTCSGKCLKGLYEFKDEIYDLRNMLNAAVKNTEDIVLEIRNTSAQLSSLSEGLAALSTQIANGTGEQTQKASHVATAGEEMSATIIEVAKNASGAAEAAKEANLLAQKGGDIVGKTVEGMSFLAKSVQGSAEVIAALGERSNEIGKIIKVIDDIADRTNLLALNAAIEAARAGEQGRGFAVVADEVRKLAERTTKATKEIGDMIGAIQDETNKAVSVMDAGIKEVEKEVKLAKEAGIALEHIVDSVEKVTGMIQQIATASEEQGAAADQISTDIEAVAGVARKTQDGANQIVSASCDIAGVASKLGMLVSRFKVKGDNYETLARSY